MTVWNFGGSVSVEAHKHAKLLNFSGQLIDPDAWGVTLAQPKKKKKKTAFLPTENWKQAIVSDKTSVWAGKCPPLTASYSENHRILIDRLELWLWIFGSALKWFFFFFLFIHSSCQTGVTQLLLIRVLYHWEYGVYIGLDKISSLAHFTARAGTLWLNYHGYERRWG